MMMSYMAMWRATGDVSYLNSLIQHAEIVFSNRDDNDVVTNTYYNGETDLPVWSKYNTDISADYPWVVHNGMITYPIADFVQLTLLTLPNE